MLFAKRSGLALGILSVFQFTQKGDEDLAGSALSTIQMLAIAFGSAFAGMVVNSSGFGHPDGLDGISNSAHWLFITWSFVLVWSVLTVSKLRVVLESPGGEETNELELETT